MMTSVVTDAARGNRDKALPQTTHTSQPQKQIQVSRTHTLHQLGVPYTQDWGPAYNYVLKMDV